MTLFKLRLLCNMVCGVHRIHVTAYFLYDFIYMLAFEWDPLFLLHHVSAGTIFALSYFLEKGGIIVLVGMGYVGISMNVFEHQVHRRASSYLNFVSLFLLFGRLCVLAAQMG